MSDPAERRPPSSAEGTEGEAGPSAPSPERLWRLGDLGEGQPPPALVVAVSGRFSGTVRSFRRWQLLLNGLALLGVLGGAAGAVAVGGLGAGALRAVGLAAAGIVGALLLAGALVRPRPLEVGRGIVARGGDGRIAPLLCLRGWLLVLAATFREAGEGLIHAAGLARQDPAVELAAFVMLALAPPHGPGPGVWVSLDGLDESGRWSLPEDLRPAVCALRSRGWIAVDRGRYPPRVRLEPEGLAFVEHLVGGSG